MFSSFWTWVTPGSITMLPVVSSESRSSVARPANRWLCFSCKKWRWSMCLNLYLKKLFFTRREWASRPNPPSPILPILDYFFSFFSIQHLYWLYLSIIPLSLLPTISCGLFRATFLAHLNHLAFVSWYIDNFLYAVLFVLSPSVSYLITDRSGYHAADSTIESYNICFYGGGCALSNEQYILQKFLIY